MVEVMKIKRNERKWIVVMIYEELWGFMQGCDDLSRVLMIYEELWWLLKTCDDLKKNCDDLWIIAMSDK